MYNLTEEIQNVENLPKWNYDGSSTNQSSGDDSEVIIIPRALFNDPFRVHAMKVNETPFLSVWCWPYNSSKKCILVPKNDWHKLE